MKKRVSVLAAALLTVFTLALALPAVLPALEARVEAAQAQRYTVSVQTGYLALRTAKAFDSANEIGELYTGDEFDVTDKSDSTYWYGYAPKYKKYGYVNHNYLVGGGSVGTSYTVSVKTGYLALRNAKGYYESNEIGELYSGDTFQVTDTSDSTYWYGYSPKHNKYGYVNRNYLIGAGSGSNGTSYTVSVKTGYLALRTAKAYDSANEIGELYSGDTFQVTDTSDSTYWYGYAPKLGKSGYVNRNYLIGAGSGSQGQSYTVSVKTGYLALRTAKAYDSANEIGKLYSGDTFQVTDKSDSTYLYGYAPKLGKSGYVNRNYLY